MWWNSLGAFFVMANIISPLTFRAIHFKASIPSFVVWLLANFIIYQTWELDNTKIFNAVWLPIAVASVSRLLLYIYKRFSRVISFLLLFFSCFTGAIAVFRCFMYPSYLYIPQDNAFEFAQWVLNNTPPNSLWLIDYWHAHPVTALAGRKALQVQPGWTFSHGMNYIERMILTKMFKKDPEDTAIMDNMGVNFLCTKMKIFKGDKNFHGSIMPSNTSKKWRLVYNKFPYIVWERNRNGYAQLDVED